MQKTVLTVIITLVFTFSSTSNVFGMMASYFGEPDDLWYTVTPEEPFRQIGYYNVPELKKYELSSQIYQNDQTFFNISYEDHSHELSIPEWGIDLYSDIMDINASYLFDSGIFIGLEHNRHLNIENTMESTATWDTNNITFISPGFRYNYSQNSYVAFSVDILDDEEETETYGYEFNLKHFQDKIYWETNIYHYLSDYSNHDTNINCQLNYQFSNQLVGGISSYFYQNDYLDDSFYAGFTWTPQPLIINFRYNYQSSDTNSQSLYAIYQANQNIGLGLQLYKSSEIPKTSYSYTLRSRIGNGHIKISYHPHYDNFLENYSLVYYQRI